MAAVDARDIVTVEDAHGGLTVYFQDRPTHYRLDGEWYRAISLPERAAPVPASDPGDGGGVNASPSPAVVR